MGWALATVVVLAALGAAALFGLLIVWLNDALPWWMD